MPLIVDTFNVLHQTGVLPPSLAGVDVAGLIDLISRSRFRRSRVRLVCDGASRLTSEAGEAGKAGSIIIEFSGRGRTADEVIARHVSRSTAPKRLTVVSSDREVQKAARKRRCTVVRSDEFLRQLAMDIERDERKPEQQDAKRPSKYMRPLSHRDTAKWMRELGVDEHGPPLTDEQLEQLDETVNKLLGTRDEADDAGERDEVAPKMSRAEARRMRAREREKEQLDADQHSDGPPMPVDLIAEAERLWRREKKSHDSP